jgi:hypothetical protein
VFEAKSAIDANLQIKADISCYGLGFCRAKSVMAGGRSLQIAAMMPHTGLRKFEEIRENFGLFLSALLFP